MHRIVDSLSISFSFSFSNGLSSTGIGKAWTNISIEQTKYQTFVLSVGFLAVYYNKIGSHNKLIDSTIIQNAKCLIIPRILPFAVVNFMLTMLTTARSYSASQLPMISMCLFTWILWKYNVIKSYYTEMKRNHEGYTKYDIQKHIQKSVPNKHKQTNKRDKSMETVTVLFYSESLTHTSWW